MKKIKIFLINRLLRLIQDFAETFLTTDLAYYHDLCSFSNCLKDFKFKSHITKSRVDFFYNRWKKVSFGREDYPVVDELFNILLNL